MYVNYMQLSGPDRVLILTGLLVLRDTFEKVDESEKNNILTSCCEKVGIKMSWGEIDGQINELILRFSK